MGVLGPTGGFVVKACRGKSSWRKDFLSCAAAGGWHPASSMLLQARRSVWSSMGATCSSSHCAGSTPEGQPILYHLLGRGRGEDGLKFGTDNSIVIFIFVFKAALEFFALLTGRTWGLSFGGLSTRGRSRGRPGWRFEGIARTSGVVHAEWAWYGSRKE